MKMIDIQSYLMLLNWPKHLHFRKEFYTKHQSCIRVMF